MRDGEEQGLDALMAKMTALKRERQQTDQPMCHFAALHALLSRLFLALSLIPLLS